MSKINVCEKKILSYGDLFLKYPDDIDFLDEKISELYFNMKDMAPMFAKKGIIQDDFRILIKRLTGVEKVLPNHFILNNEPLNPNFHVRKENQHDKNEQEIVKYIVAQARKYLVSIFKNNLGLNDVHLEALDLLGLCAAASRRVSYIALAADVECKVYTIAPAFCEKINVFERGANHQFCIITIGEKSYIVDVTYSQFFTMRANNLDRIGIPLLGGCHVGIYMTLDEKRRAFAEKLMRDGWIEVTDENIKLYLDGFAMHSRNGIYYEHKGIVDYTADYTAPDYMKFLKREDNQLNHEPIEGLGRQRRLLKNPHQNFRVVR